MSGFIALIHQDPGSDYGVSFPDFPGCVTAGASIDEAKDMAQEALSGHVELMREEGLDIPRPTSLEDILADPKNRDATGLISLTVSLRGAKRRGNLPLSFSGI